MSHEDDVERLIKCFKKVVTHRVPETEEEFIYTLEFFGILMVSLSSSKYRWNLLRKSEWEDVVKNFNPSFQKVIDDLVKIVCEKFKLKGEAALEKWFNKTAKKFGLKICYNKAVYRYIS